MSRGAAVTFGRKSAQSPLEFQGVGAARLEGAPAPLLVSSRRRPAVHALDSAPLVKITPVFTGAGGKPWIAWEDEDYTWVQPLDGPAEPKIKFRDMLKVIPAADRTLLWEIVWYGGSAPIVVEAWSLPHGGDKPQLLMFDAKESKRSPDTSAAWLTPEDFRLRRPSLPLTLQPMLHRDSLWVLRIQKEEYRSTRASYRLIGFLPGQEKPREVPLKFELSAEDQAHLLLKERDNATENPDCREGGFVSNDQALAFSGINLKGVWLLRWDEVEAWVRAHAGP